ncbi:MAG: hypothetical protein HC772_14345 [Leptolyngbyaceae cyanobacterium CRU_2_3]|nr:hypothetical protein [Leptolyngbyaceae cyanobacterium CRU_2_3]
MSQFCRPIVNFCKNSGLFSPKRWLKTEAIALFAQTMGFRTRSATLFARTMQL